MSALRVGDKPIRGYTLVKKLGQGGFGTVWQADGPGEVACALKFLSLGDKLGQKEHRAVKLLKNLKHTNLIPIAAYWLRDGNGNILGAEDNSLGSTEFQRKNCDLVIQLGLGDKSLADRLKEYRQDKPRDSIDGLPTNELLRYMQQAADAIDWLNEPIHMLGEPKPVAVRHGDIKPGNMLIVGRGLWVCDFGLAGIFRGTDIRSTMGKPLYTPAYAAPEILSYRGASPFSDQYSLAVSYVELRTGRFPYDAETQIAVEAMIVSGAVYLDFMSEPEQRVLRRAMAMKPEDRFPSCVEFVEHLNRAVSEISGRSARPPNAAELFTTNSTVIPGFRLKRHIGGGGYGEVWEAAGARRDAALKIVKNLSDKKGKQEWRALEDIKDELDHSHLMAIQGYWLLDPWGDVIPEDDQKRQPAYLVIHTELAKGSLRDRLRECQSKGEQGIPVDELLRYMRESADALDYLNNELHTIGGKEGWIIHRDIKPENILLTKTSKVKISDFGLAKMMEGNTSALSRNSEGLTVVYGAPELHRNKLSQRTDQYSLAVTYFHLRVGHLPMDMSLTPFEINFRSGTGELDLNGLPDAERAIIAKATSVAPEGRFESCGEMVRALYQAVGAPLPSYPTLDSSSSQSSSPSDPPSSGTAPSSSPEPSNVTQDHPQSLPTSDSPPIVVRDRKRIETSSDFDIMPIEEILKAAKRVETVVKPHETPKRSESETDGPGSKHDIHETPGPRNNPKTSPFSVGEKTGGAPVEIAGNQQPVQGLLDRSKIPDNPTPPQRRESFDDRPDSLHDIKIGTTAQQDVKEKWRPDTSGKPKPPPVVVRPPVHRTEVIPDVVDEIRRKKSPVAAIAGGVAAIVLVLGVVWILFFRPPVPVPIQVEQLSALIEIAEPTPTETEAAKQHLAELEQVDYFDVKKWHVDVDDWNRDVTLVREIREIVPAKLATESAKHEVKTRRDKLKVGDPKVRYAKLDKDIDAWKNSNPEPGSYDSVETIQKTVDELVKADVSQVIKTKNDLQVFKTKLIEVEGRAAQLREKNKDAADGFTTKLNVKKVEVGKALIDKLKEAVPNIDRDEPTSGKSEKQTISEIKTYWLKDTPNESFSSLDALTKAKVDKKPMELLALLNGERLPAMHEELVKELDPSLPFADNELTKRKKTLNFLWNNHHDKLAGATDNVQQWHYSELVKAIKNMVEQETPNWPEIIRECNIAEEKVRGKTSLRERDLVAAALAEGALSNTANLTSDAKTAFHISLGTSTNNYVKYVDARLIDDLEHRDECAELIMSAFSGNAPPPTGPLKTKARRAAAANILRTSANWRWGDKRLPLVEPSDQQKSDISKWLNKAAAIDNDALDARMSAIRAIVSTNDKDIREAMAAIKTKESLDALGNDKFLFLKVQAKALENGSSAADKLSALRTYHELIQAVREHNEKREDTVRPIDVKSKCISFIDGALKNGIATLDSGRDLSVEQKTTFRNDLVELFAEKARLVGENITLWENADAIAMAKAAFENAISLDGKQKASAVYLVEKTLLEKDTLAPEAILNAATTAAEYDPKHFLPIMLEGIYHLRVAKNAYDAQSKDQVISSYKNAIAKFESVCEKIESLPKPWPKEAQLAHTISSTRRVTICNFFDRSNVDVPESKTDMNFVRKYVSEQGDFKQFADVELLVAISRTIEDLAWPRSNTPQFYKTASNGFSRAVKLDRKSEYLIDRGRINFEWVAFGQKDGKADFELPIKDLREALEDLKLTEPQKRQARMHLGHIYRCQGQFKDALSQYESACQLDANANIELRKVPPWYALSDLIVDQGESGIRPNAEILEDLRTKFANFKNTQDPAFKRLMQTIEGYVTLFSSGEKKTLKEINSMLGLVPSVNGKSFPDHIFVDIEKGDWEARDMILRRALTWLELFNGDKIDVSASQGGDNEGFRKTIELLILASADRKQTNLFLEAKLKFHCCLAYLWLSDLEKGSKATDRIRAFALIKEVCELLHPDTFVVRGWLEKFARRVNSSVTKHQQRGSQTQKAELEIAMKYVEMAKRSAVNANDDVNARSLQLLHSTLVTHLNSLEK